MSQLYWITYIGINHNEYGNVICEKVKSGDKEIYHPRDEDTIIKSIKSKSNNAKILYNDGSTTQIDIDYIHKMESSYEVYVIGGRASATNTKVNFEGEYSGSCELKQYSGKANIMVNSTNLIGESDAVTSEWDWSICDTGGAEFVKRSDELSEYFGNNTCIAIGYNEPINQIKTIDIIYDN